MNEACVKRPKPTQAKKRLEWATQGPSFRCRVILLTTCRRQVSHGMTSLGVVAFIGSGLWWRCTADPSTALRFGMTS